MLLLSADTSGKHGSLALAQCQTDGNCDVIEVVSMLGGTFSAQLVPQIAALLAKHGFSKHEIDGFAVASGPGSFTGLRVGLAAIKALADALRKPIAAVSLLEALAATHAQAGVVLALMDAGRGEVFAGAYEIVSRPPSMRAISEELVRIEDLHTTAVPPHVVTADQTLADLLCGKGITVELVDRPRSDAIAYLGWRKIQAGGAVSPEGLEANYLRRSDAEIFSKP